VATVFAQTVQPRTEGTGARVIGPTGPAYWLSAALTMAAAWQWQHVSTSARPLASAQNEKVNAVNDFFGIVAAGPAFFISSWLLMLFAGITGSEVGIRPFGYITSMVVTIGLWLVIAPAAGAIARTGGRTGKKKA
jgi:hypothetical protein